MERIGGTPTQPVYELKTEGPVEIGCVVLREDLTHGQRVEGFRILGIDEENKADYALFEGTCIGNKHICELEDPFAVQNPLTGHTNKKLSGVRVQITAARDEVFMREIYITKGKAYASRNKVDGCERHSRFARVYQRGAASAPRCTDVGSFAGGTGNAENGSGN